ncbi:hypothetical protein [Streptomyces lasiicapitis]|uniref:hypothetical protein n=1 Tax=Streptomyces lasiicapitis TaxID=1923961 RepID=UPI00365D2831
MRITYAWCATCRRFKGWTGPDIDGLEFNDPLEKLPQEKRRNLQQDFTLFLDHLDKLWSSGELPQRFTHN